MPNLKELRMKVTFGKTVPYWWRFAYLIPDVFRTHTDIESAFSKVLQGTDTAFAKLVQTQVEAYMQKGAMPPADIAAPIINIAEDIMAGREPVMRAGDYIALQNHVRK
jgi:hypothetical protein